MIKRLKKVRSGRPKKPNGQMQRTSNDENVYIVDHPVSERIFSILANQSIYKNITQTGPNKNKKIAKEQLRVIDEEELANKEAEASENVKKALIELQIDDPQFFFFLSKKQKIYNFENGKLIDKTEYKMIEKDEFYQNFHYLIDQINLVNKQLDDNFIDVLKEILIQYQSLVLQEENTNYIIEKILQTIKNPENQDKFQYLLIWQRLKSITQETRMNRRKINLEILQEEINKKKSAKVKEKHQKFYDQQLKELNDQITMDPLQYLITELILEFNQTIGENQQFIDSWVQ